MLGELEQPLVEIHEVLESPRTFRLPEACGTDFRFSHCLWVVASRQTTRRFIDEPLRDGAVAKDAATDTKLEALNLSITTILS
jgi:hypothetical protein